MLPAREFSAASRSSIAVLKPGPAALRLDRRAVRADSRIRALRGNSLALIRVDRVPSIPRVLVLPVLGRAVREALAAVLALALAPVSALRVPVALALDQADLRLRVKLHALLVLPDRRVAVAASSTPRLKKAR